MKKLIYALLVFSLTVSAAAFRNRYSPQTSDYGLKGAHEALTSSLIDLTCFNPPSTLSRQTLKDCLWKLRNLALKTYGRQKEYLEATQSIYYGAFARTTAPSDWDVHTPLLKVILDRVPPATRSRNDVINPGLWMSCSRQAELIAEEMLKRSKGMNSVSVNLLSDLITAGENFRQEILTSGPDRKPNLAKLYSIFDDAAVATRATIAELKGLYSKEKESWRNDYMAPLAGISKRALGTRLKIAEIPKCSGANIEKYNNDGEFPTLVTPADSEAFWHALRDKLDRSILALVDLMPSETKIEVCYDSVGFAVDDIKRIQGHDRQHHDHLIGHFFVTIRGTYNGSLAFRTKISSNERVPYMVRFTKLDLNGRIANTWTNFVRPDVTPNATLQKKWLSGELVRNFETDFLTDNTATPEEAKTIANTYVVAEKKVSEVRRQRQDSFNRLAIETLPTLPAMQEWQGASQAMRTYALLLVPQSFEMDSELSGAIRLDNGRVGDRESLIRNLNQDRNQIVRIVNNGDETLFLNNLENIKKIVTAKTAPEFAPQEIGVITNTNRSLLTTREKIKTDTPSENIETALYRLRGELKKFVKENGG